MQSRMQASCSCTRNLTSSRICDLLIGLLAVDQILRVYKIIRIINITVGTSRMTGVLYDCAKMNVMPVYTNGLNHTF
jgi:hypothetical protein